MKAVVMGASASLWDDLSLAQTFGPFDLIVACNAAGVVYPGDIDVWATLEAHHMEGWRLMREAEGYSPAGVHASHLRAAGIDQTHSWKIHKGCTIAGSSGLYGATVAYWLGCTKIILAGVPMLPSAGQLGQEGEWNVADWSYHKGWVEAYPVLKDKVRSVSGWTKAILGAPDDEWWNGGAE